MIFKLSREIKRTKLPLLVLLSSCFLLFVFTSCTSSLVQKYDEKLLNDTSEFYEKGAEIIAEGINVSPKTNDDRSAISNPGSHPAHISAFEPKYNALLVESEVLILNAMAGSKEIDKAGKVIQQRLSGIIDKSIPSHCSDLQTEFIEVSLTVANYVDLKCIILNWQQQHGDNDVTKGTGILKKANWEARKRILFNAILAIQSAEVFKKEKK